MKYTAIDLSHHKIGRSLRGYKTSEVDELLREIGTQFEEYALDTVRMQNQIEQMREEIARFKEMEQTLNNAILLAQRSADELRSNARAEAEQIVSQARQDAQMMRQNAERDSSESLCEMRRLAQRRDLFVDTLRSASRDLSEWIERRRWEELITLPAQDAATANVEAGELQSEPAREALA